MSLQTIESSKILDILNEIEDQYDVSTWMFYDWHVWPFARRRISQILNSRYNASRANNRYINSPIKSMADFYRCLKATKLKIYQYKKRSDAFRSNFDFAQLKREDYFFILDQGRFYWNNKNELVSDFAFIENHLIQMNIPSVVGLNGVDVVDFESVSYQNLVELKRFFWRRSSIRLAQPNWWDEYLEVARLVKRLSGREIRLDFLYELPILHKASLLYQQLFKKLSIKHLLCVCYYRGDSLAAILAARRLGIKVTDVQHGAQSNMGVMYERWRNTPPSGYELIPDYFWCWSDHIAGGFEKRNKSSFKNSIWFSGGNGAVSNALMELSQTESDNYNAAMNLAEKATLRIALLTSALSMSYKADIAKLVANCNSDWIWFNREHPQLRPLKDNIKSIFNDAGVLSRIEMDLANEMPLYELIDVCDLVVTDWSTCAMEGMILGKPCVTIHENGKTLYSDALEAGVMSFLDLNDPDTYNVIIAASKVDREFCKNFARKHYFEDPDIAFNNIRNIYTKEFS